MTLKGSHLEEAKKLVGVILGADEHLGTVQNIDTLTHIDIKTPRIMIPRKNRADF